jgi:hypothetical protein
MISKIIIDKKNHPEYKWFKYELIVVIVKWPPRRRIDI